MSIHYYNQTAPFWDFVASFEDQRSPRAAADNNQNAAEGREEQPEDFQGHWGFPFMFGPRGGHRGRGRGHHHPHPPPHHHFAGPPHGFPHPPPPHVSEPGEEGSDSKEPSAGPAQPSSSSSPPHHEGPSPRGRCGGRGGNRGWGGPFGRHPHHPMNPFEQLAGMFQGQFFNNGNDESQGEKDESFQPEADVFDTSDAFVIHVSLPGAKKEDVAVNWDAEKSELSIAGVVYRPGDEEFLKTLAMNERQVGLFERKIRLGSRANPAQVDVDGIAAKMEDGVLRVNVPKLDSGYVEIKKVDIE